MTNSKSLAKPSANDARYREARVAVIQRIDYWNEADNPALFLAFKICQQLANENYGKAYYLLSMLYDSKQDDEDGQDQARHFAQLAFDWCCKHQSNNDLELWCDLGDLYQHQNVANNFEHAAFWFRMAAEQGYAEAQHNLSHAYIFGMGVPEDITEALKWCKLAALQGHVMAQTNLMHRLNALSA